MGKPHHPLSRDRFRDALMVLREYTPEILAMKCCGLSLSDQYWVCPKGSDLKWEDVDFFHNVFSTDMGEILFGYEPADLERINWMSPDSTTDGWLCKKWIIRGGKRILMKGGSSVYRQEPLNEVVASAVMRRLAIPHVPYSLCFDEDKPYSLCENFVTPDTELVPAWHIVNTRKKDNRDSPYTHFLRCCNALEIPNVRHDLGKLLTLDYIIANEDRHYYNFGAVRNADTLEWMGLAPVYDSGTSLWHNTLKVGSRIECKPFKKDPAEQLKLVEDLSWFDKGALNGIGPECIDILKQSTEIDDARSSAIAEAMEIRIGRVERLRGERSR